MAHLDHIAEGLRGFAVPLAQLAYDPRNARKHDRRNIDAIKHSLQRFGQRIPIIVQREGMVVRAGNGRLAAAKELGWTHMAALVLEEADAEAAAFAIADNRTAELAEWDWQNLADTLAELRVELPDYSASDLGWNDAELAGLQLANAWDDAQTERDALAGSRTNVDRSTLVLRFTEQQERQLLAHVQAAHLGDVVTSEAVLALLVGR
jgi:ParB-like chromosome segregation protein Spo0J